MTSSSGVPFKLSYVDFAPRCAGAGGVVCTPDYERFKSVHTIRTVSNSSNSYLGIYVCSRRQRYRYEDLYSAPSWEPHPCSAPGMDHTAITLQIHYTCLYLVSVHQTAPPLASGSMQPSDYSLLLSYRPRVRMKGWVGLVSWPTADGLLI